jgi:biopolymer transport protein ExbD
MSVRLDHGDETLNEIHEINVTPFIDVILVLLIIFMIAAPLATVDISVDLPAANVDRTPRPDKPLFLTLKSDLSVSVDNDPVNRAALASALDQATANDRQQRVFLRADKTVPYGELMNLMNELRSAGYLHVALVGLEAEKPRSWPQYATSRPRDAGPIPRAGPHVLLWLCAFTAWAPWRCWRAGMIPPICSRTHR